VPEVLNKNGHKITLRAEIQDRWEEHFQKKLNLTVNPDPEVLQKFSAQIKEEPPLMLEVKTA